MRGEHGAVCAACEPFPGSSPHARGTRHGGHEAVKNRGIIPACAGNTPGAAKDIRHRRDHPRMRGEHLVTRLFMPLAAGSSPHARGTQNGGAWRRMAVGIIPACAGNTLAKCSNFKGYMNTPSSVSFTFVLRTICGVAYISHSPIANSPADFHHKVQRFRTIQDTGQYASRC